MLNANQLLVLLVSIATIHIYVNIGSFVKASQELMSSNAKLKSN